MISNSSTGPGFLYLELNAPRSRVSVDVRYCISYVFLMFVIFLIFILVVLCLSPSLLIFLHFLSTAFAYHCLTFPCCCMRNTKILFGNLKGRDHLKGTYGGQY